MQELTIGLHHFQALPQRALYWPAQSMLLLADLHLGKTDSFRQLGVGVPHSMQQQDLVRLRNLLDLCAPQRCVVLGDFVHGPTLHATTQNAWNTLVTHYPDTRFELVLGNHDRAFNPERLTVHAIHQFLQIQDVLLSHEPLPDTAWHADLMLNIYGHLHPAVQVIGSAKKLPALIWQPPYLCLPAFSEFTAGVSAPGTYKSIWVFVEEAEVIQIR